MEQIGLCCDHAGFELKDQVKAHLVELGLQVVDFGTDSTASCDYPDFAHPMALAIEKGEFTRGIAMCGSGNGITMTLNKHQGIRAALCWKPDIAQLSKAHNDANVCSLPARYISFNEAKDIIAQFLNTSFEGGRHTKRVDKIPVKH